MFIRLILRKVLAFKVFIFIRLVTIMTGAELTTVLVTLASAPAVLGLSAMRAIFILLSIWVQFRVVRVVVRLR